MCVCMCVYVCFYPHVFCILYKSLPLLAASTSNHSETVHGGGFIGSAECCAAEPQPGTHCQDISPARCDAALITEAAPASFTPLWDAPEVLSRQGICCEPPAASSGQCGCYLIASTSGRDKRET
ncbi:uncharacterized protein LOC123513385 [Portunus trituberculatus]|uniref:uncharacterized protein LOC123513385 n=1 Tax=Portunus trituberculatus TaxID=210409 RepID=UPI001E1CDEA7|nr:uncharacterized protein LOC123513385 [Portunus trituberculatus]